MGQDIKASFEKHKNLVMIISIIIMFFNIYINYFNEFTSLGYRNALLDKIVNFWLKIGLFNKSYSPALMVILLTAMFTLTDRGKKNIELSKKTVIYLILASTFIFIIVSLAIDYIDNLYFFSLLYIISFLYLIKTYSFLGRLLNTDIMKDRFNKVNKIFPQMEHIIENDMSVNIPFEFITKYDKKNRPTYKTGYINLIAPERATMVLGKPGSGKSYSFVEEIIKQHIKKGFSMINYDYKFPTLTNVSYNYYNTYKSSYAKYENKGDFAVINLDQPKYSYKCNPVSKEIIRNKQHAIDAVYTLFFNIDKKSAQKQDFFQMSAMAITSATLWFLRIYKDGMYCSLPHLIEFINRSDEDILPILDSYDELRYFTSSFSDALKKESFEQLSGQTASARIPLGKCATDEMFWVMAPLDGDKQIDLRVNRKEAVTVLNIANNPETQKTNGPALGLFMSQAAKLINAHDRVPCDFLVDELPTIFINGLNTLIATARSNKVCTLLSIQDYTQIVNEYGREQADTIFNTVDNIICGKVATDTAEKVSKSVGKINYKTQSISISKDSTSTSFNTQREYVVPPEDIAQFSQGEFVGIVSDTYKQPIELKAFRGLVSPDKSDLNNEHVPPVYPDLTEEDLQANANRIRNDITIIISNELSRIEEEKISDIEEDENYTHGSLDTPPDHEEYIPVNPTIIPEEHDKIEDHKTEEETLDALLELEKLQNLEELNKREREFKLPIDDDDDDDEDNDDDDDAEDFPSDPSENDALKHEMPNFND